MKKILGLDLGTTSIGWAYVQEAENDDEKSSIQRLGVRVIPLTTDENINFQAGKAITTTADRTLKRSMRRNLARYKLRRDNLIAVLKDNGFIDEDSILTEDGSSTTFETWKLRAAAVERPLRKAEIARVLLMLNKKRGYKSGRKMNTKEEGSLIDGMEVAKILYEQDMTPGQFVYQRLLEGYTKIPEFYRSDLVAELDRVWTQQQQHYPDVFSSENRKSIDGKGKTLTGKFFMDQYEIETPKTKGKPIERKILAYKRRSDAGKEKVPVNEAVASIADINGDIAASSGYLGDISDRSKELYFKNQTIGQHCFALLLDNSHNSLKNKVFYRQDYLDEFEKIWEKQAPCHPEMTRELKSEIRDLIIFYQRRLKSQKHLIRDCEFEKYHKAIPKSSPLFQDFRIWQFLNNLKITIPDEGLEQELTQEESELLYADLTWKSSMSKSEVLKRLGYNRRGIQLNYEKIIGNQTNASFLEIYQKMLIEEGYDLDFGKLPGNEICETLSKLFGFLGIKQDILDLSYDLQGDNFFKQPGYELWHLLYSFEGDNTKVGYGKLISKLCKRYGFSSEQARLLANLTFPADYGSLSARAIRKILPHLRAGLKYHEACLAAGYNHSSSLTSEEELNRPLKEELVNLPKNSLRNPVVEKVLNQLLNLLNEISRDTALGKPDEVRIELARELKMNAVEREKANQRIRETTADREKIAEILKNEFGIGKVTRGDIIRYRLYCELEMNGFKTLYDDLYIPREKLFSKEIDIDHIIPQSLLFDDSFSNKTLSYKQVNIEKGNETAYDYLKTKLSPEQFDQFFARVNDLYEKNQISRAKKDKLLMKREEIPDGFIERELRSTQYISRKAHEILKEWVKVVVPTTGSVTHRLRQDWQLIDLMKEINMPRYRQLGLTEMVTGKNGENEELILEWTKRNDHRHHAVDALTVAFTRRSHIQILNNLNARSDKGSSIYGIAQKELYRDHNHNLRFKAPMFLDEFRQSAKFHLDSILVSHKAKNKVVTRNVNRIDTKKGEQKQVTLTPRGQLHKETIYGCRSEYKTGYVRVGSQLDYDTALTVAQKKYREALLKRLQQFNNDPVKAFTKAQAPSRNPIWIDDLHTEKVPDKVKRVWLEKVYTIRKEINPDLDVSKVVDIGIRRILENRLKAYDGNKKQAFANLEGNPIFVNEEKGIVLKRVTITGVTTVESLHDKRDRFDRLILDDEGHTLPVDFVSTGNNHHVAIYRDSSGNLHEEVVSFFEAVHRVNLGMPVITKEHPKGWEFLFTLKQNEFFVFPKDDFDPMTIDLTDPSNYSLISPHLFRVQKIASKNYVFNHHLVTKAVDGALLKNYKNLAGETYHIIRTPAHLAGIQKVRVNHLGRIVHVGE